jgi:hypothetical protein
MMSTSTDQNPDPLLWSARKERARRWVGSGLSGYPALSEDEETEETLAAEPPESGKKPARTAD